MKKSLAAQLVLNQFLHGTSKTRNPTFGYYPIRHNFIYINQIGRILFAYGPDSVPPLYITMIVLLCMPHSLCWLLFFLLRHSHHQHCDCFYFDFFPSLPYPTMYLICYVLVVDGIVGQIYFFRQITTFIKVRMAYVIRLQTL